MVLFLLFLLASVFALPPRITVADRPCPTETRDDLLVCLTFLDANEDGTLTTTEIDDWIGNHTDCLPTSTGTFWDGATITSYCDADLSGNLTMSDWNDASSCITLPEQQFIMCLFCVKCVLYPAPEIVK